MKSTSRNISAIAITALGASLLVALGSPASAVEPDDTKSGLVDTGIPAISTEAPSKSVSSVPLPENGTGIPAEAYGEIARAEDALGAAFNASEWIESERHLILHTNAPVDQATVEAISAAVATVDVVFVENDYNRAELSDMAWTLASSGTSIAGRTIVSAGPNTDSSGLSITLDEASGSPNARQALPDEIDGVPVEIDLAPAPVSTSRDYDPQPPHWGGAKMSRPSTPGRLVSCTTGFGVGTMSGSTVQTEMITAHHCGAAGTTWRTGNYSDSPFLGTMRDTKALGADIQRLSGSSFQGVVYTGPNGSSAASYVNGAVRPILGDSYCISGARSGLVCRNIVTSMNQSICYPADLVCYTGQVYTNQESRVPAAGQGDSGGPAFATSSGASAGIYASGIISGIFGNSTVCTAEQDGRLCSFQVILAPVSSFFADNPGYGILASQPGS
jgi:hypothetical protein